MIPIPRKDAGFLLADEYARHSWENLHSADKQLTEKIEPYHGTSSVFGKNARLSKSKSNQARNKHRGNRRRDIT